MSFQSWWVINVRELGKNEYESPPVAHSVRHAEWRWHSCAGMRGSEGVVWGEKTRENVESDIKRWRNKMIYPAAAATLPFTRPVTVLLIVLVAIAHSRGRFGPSNRTRSAKLLFNFIYTLALFLYSPWRVSPLSLLFLSLLLSHTHTHSRGCD